MNMNIKTPDELNVTITLTNEEFEEYFCFCNDCNTPMLISNAVRINGKYYCHHCTTTCDCCGRAIRTSDSFRPVDSGYHYCSDCFENETYQCDDCGNRFRYEDELREVNGRWYCNDCYPSHRPIIQDYHTMKNYGDIKFLGTEKRTVAPYMGIELEIDSHSFFDREYVAEELQGCFGEFFTYENDGSLNNGFEMISQPASLSYHLEMMPQYRKAFRFLSDCGISSHDVGTCGLHIHIDRTYFGRKEDSATAKLLYLFEKFKPELIKFSRRTETQTADWCRFRKQNYSKSAGWIKKAVQESKAISCYQYRYFAINLTNENTIEIRLNRGTLNPQTLEATLKFTARLAEICKTVRSTELAKMTFEDLLGSDEVILLYWNRINNK